MVHDKLSIDGAHYCIHVDWVKRLVDQFHNNFSVDLCTVEFKESLLFCGAQFW